MNRLFIGIFLVVLLSSFIKQKHNIDFDKSDIYLLQQDTTKNITPGKENQPSLSTEHKSITPIESRNATVIDNSENKTSTKAKIKLKTSGIESSEKLSSKKNETQSAAIPEKSKSEEKTDKYQNAPSNSESRNNIDQNNLNKTSNSHSIDSILENQLIDEKDEKGIILSFLNKFKKTNYSNYALVFFLFLVILIAILYFKLRSNFQFQTNKNIELSNEIQRLQIVISSLTADSLKQQRVGKNDNTDVNIVEQEKKVKEFLLDIIDKNKLSNSEILSLTNQSQNRWISVGHSAIGKMHIKSIPQIPCQDNHYFELLNTTWNLSIVCDGAGSAKYSHLGSEFFANKSIPKRIKALLSKSGWYTKNIIPTDIQWREFIINVLHDCYTEFQLWYPSLEMSDVIEKDFATTIIISIHNEKCVLVANIGDGRGGYLNDQGEFKPLFVPYKGIESNSTVFITSPIWQKPYDLIQTKVIQENLISVFILSDGMEKVSFNCSILVQKWIDPNLPYRNFFYPILSKIKNLTKEEEENTLSEMWIKFIEEGNDIIKSESDDKTMIISFLK